MAKPKSIEFIYRNLDADLKDGMHLAIPEIVRQRVAHFGCTRNINIGFSYEDETAQRALIVKPPTKKSLDIGLFMLGMECAATACAGLQLSCGDGSQILVPRDNVKAVMRMPKPAENTIHASKADHIAAMWSPIKEQFDAHASIRSKHKNMQLELFMLPSKGQADPEAEQDGIAYRLGSLFRQEYRMTG